MESELSSPASSPKLLLCIPKFVQSVITLADLTCGSQFALIEHMSRTACCSLRIERTSVGYCSCGKGIPWKGYCGGEYVPCSRVIHSGHQFFLRQVVCGRGKVSLSF